MASTTGRQGNVDSVGKKGRIDTRSAADPTRETPDSLGTLQKDATKKFEQPVSYAAIRANKAGSSLHAGAPDDGGPPGDFSSVKESRGIVEQAGMFSAAAGNSPKRSAGTKTPTDRATREKLATAEGG
jgi:hypothetical protein